MYPKNLNRWALENPSVSKATLRRMRMERAIVRRLVRHLLETGHSLSVDNGGDEYELVKSCDFAKVIDAMGECDSETLLVHSRLTGKHLGSIMLVYGNDGWDLIADYHVSLEGLLKPINDYTNRLSVN